MLPPSKLQRTAEQQQKFVTQIHADLIFRRVLSAPNHKSQIASDLKSQSPNRKNFPQIAVLSSSNRTFKSRDL